MSNPKTVSPRPGRQLFEATLPFAADSPTRSWWNVGSTLAVLLVVLVGAAVAPWWPLRLAASISGGLVMVRTFILFHDYMHSALLSESRLAQILFPTLGVLMLTPPRHWRYRHSAQDRQENSIPIQRDQVREWASKNGVEIIHEFADAGKSGLTRDAVQCERTTPGASDAARCRSATRMPTTTGAVVALRPVERLGRANE